MIDEDSKVKRRAYRIKVFMLSRDPTCTISTTVVPAVMTLGIHTIGEYD